jgi:hypothetical protein
MALRCSGSLTVFAAIRPRFDAPERLGGAKAESARSPPVVMLGDSITAVADWNALLPSFHVANRGISGETTEDVGVLKARSGDPIRTVTVAGKTIRLQFSDEDFDAQQWEFNYLFADDPYGLRRLIS